MNTPELCTALEAIFLRQVAGLRRARSPYSSSFPIEELELTFEDGTMLPIIFKNLSSEAMLETARAVKPDFLYAPSREIQVYQSLLTSLDLGTPQMYGAILERSLERYCLFLEKVPAEELWKIGNFETWLNAARWITRLQSSCDPDSARAAVPELLEYNAAYYWYCLERAREVAGSELDRIAARYDRVVNILCGLPRTVIHGEFYASNILVQNRGNQIRICPVDWEMAATGPVLMDVAALASGKWNRNERLNILGAYRSALPERFEWSEGFITGFDCCQLHIALQWLGWSRNWSPPATHVHDWLAHALRISGQDTLAPLFAD